jgi:hypothetical protein
VKRAPSKQAVQLAREIEASYAAERGLGDWSVLRYGIDLLRAPLTPLGIKADVLKTLLSVLHPRLSKSQVEMDIADQNRPDQNKIDLVGVLLAARQNPQVRAEALKLLSAPDAPTVEATEDE